jgi:hypothetical protein
LLHFGFPTSLVSVISTLFFETQITLSINGWSSESLLQARGVRQGDPLSPLLFTLGIEPLLRTILATPLISGVSMNMIVPPVSTLKAYGPHLAWHPVVEETGLEWHDAHNDNSIRYLGYPLYHNDAQLNSFLHDIKIKVERHVRILRQRRLSIRGLGMVANSLLLSKVWHLLRVLAAPVTWLKEIKKIIRDYIITFWPKAAYSDLCLKRKYGGIGLVDIEDQN